MNKKRTTIKKEMAITHSDFFRMFPNAVSKGHFSLKNLGARVESAEGIWTIDLGSESVRQLALLSIPKTMVTMTFEGYSDQGQEKALKLFDQAFRRGGG